MNRGEGPRLWDHDDACRECLRRFPIYVAAPHGNTTAGGSHYTLCPECTAARFRGLQEPLPGRYLGSIRARLRIERRTPRTNGSGALAEEGPE